MFKCQKCEALEAEIAFLRETNSKLTDRLVAVASPLAYQAINPTAYDERDYYGNEHDEMIEFDEFGQKIILKRQQSEN